MHWSYAEYQTQANRLAGGLMELSAESGDRVGVSATNCAKWCSTQFTTAKIGAILVCINPTYRVYELEHCAPGQLRAEKLPNLTAVTRTGTDSTPGTFNFEQVCQMNDSITPQALADRCTGFHPDDPINMQFTSGTTGNPKGATLSHHNILNNAQMTAVGMAFTEADRLCIPVPSYHWFRMVLGTLVCVTASATAVFPAVAEELKPDRKQRQRSE